MNTLPLLPGALATQTIAYRNQRPVSQAEFLGDILALAARLPQTGHVFNLCKDRYWFSVALFAAISRGVVSLLQNSTAPENMATLFQDFPDAVCLGEQATPILEQMAYVVVPHAALPVVDTPPQMPQIPSTQQIARIFTSGSTGKPQSHSMSFGRMQQCAIIEAERMWDVAGGPCSVVGTVSPQHMFGLEVTVMLSIFGGGQFSARQPFFPADVASALAEVPEPRLLVSTPFHLRKLMDAQIPLPRVSAVMSATAPLSLELAQEIETQLNAPVVEMYGSTETGALATRRPTQEAEWTTYPGITLQQDQNQDQQTHAHAAHFDAPQMLNDRVDLLSPSRFRLLGRNSDMVNIVGKRNSLAFLNQLLTNLAGVEDGVFCTHESGSAAETARLAAFVVAPSLTDTAILAALRQHIDPVFLPRPLIFVKSLPRDSNGKLAAAALAALRATHLAPRI